MCGWQRIGEYLFMDSYIVSCFVLWWAWGNPLDTSKFGCKLDICMTAGLQDGTFKRL